MQIIPFNQDPHQTAELVDLINYCQNIEAKLGIKMAEQDDIFQVADHYRKPGGEFWVAIHEHRLVGCIALLPVGNGTAVLKKFFTYPEFRGQPERLGAKLCAVFAEFAASHHFRRIVLDTPEAEHRSHAFYAKQGFHQIPYAALGVNYTFPDRESRYYEKFLN